MKLGLWMSPMHFNPRLGHLQGRTRTGPARRSATALALYNAAEPDSGSNEAGLGMWGPAAIPHIERRIRDAIDVGRQLLQVRLPRVGWTAPAQGDLYDYHDAFVAMLDRLSGDHPGGDVPDRRDERLPAVPVRVGGARADVVPERLSDARRAAAQPLEPEPLGAGLVARPALPRRTAVRSNYPVDTLDGRGAARRTSRSSATCAALPADVVDAARGRGSAFYTRAPLELHRR